jgi:hypothetical protein
MDQVYLGGELVREIDVVFTVEREDFPGGKFFRAVGQHYEYTNGGRTIVPVTTFGPPCRHVWEAQLYAKRGTNSVFNCAESDNVRFDHVKSYLNARKARVAVPAAQLELL